MFPVIPEHMQEELFQSIPIFNILAPSNCKRRSEDVSQYQDRSKTNSHYKTCSEISRDFDNVFPPEPIHAIRESISSVSSWEAPVSSAWPTPVPIHP